MRERFVIDGLEAALERQASKRVYTRKWDGEQEAHLVALGCSQPPEARGRWTLTLLAQKLVELAYVAPETMRTTLKQMNVSPG